MKAIKKIFAAMLAIVMLTASTVPVYASMNGIDISGWQPTINTATVDADFVIVKATEGLNYKNPYGISQINGTINSGKKLGLYHFATGVSATQEADFFVNTVSDYIGKAVLVLDYEANALRRGSSYVKAFCDRVYQKTGVKPIVYTTAYVVRSQGFSEVKRAGYGLWVAGYPSNTATRYTPNKKMPYNLGIYDRAVMWQYSSNGIVSGYNGRLDINVYYGDEIDWDKLASTGNVSNGSTVIEGTEKQTVANPTTPSGSTLDLAYAVLNKSLDGDARKKYLGTRYDEVQSFINSVYTDSMETVISNTLSNVYGFGNVRRVVLGSRYDSVQSEINRRVNSWKTPALVVDGVMGKETIKAWQRRIGVTADGVIGTNTIKAIQRWAGVTADGVLGPQTKRAVQRKLGVNADGVWGKQTISALQRYLNR